MGTRHIIAIKEGGEFKVINYGQWDGYPSGQGLDLLTILKETNFERLRKNINNIDELDQERVSKMWHDVGVDIEGCNGFVSMEQSKAYYKNVPHLSRDAGASIIKYLENKEKPLMNPKSFGNAAEGTWCEWFYVIDMDKMVLSCFYRPFFNIKVEAREKYNNNKQIEETDFIYMPDYSLFDFDLNNLPERDEFIMLLNDEEDEDDE